MIVEGLVSVVVALINFILGLIPDLAVPGWASSAAASVNNVMGFFNGMGAWVPMGLAWTVIGAVIACYGVGFVIKIIRIIASFFTAGGGSAA